MRLLLVALAVACLGSSCKIKEDSSKLTGTDGRDLAVVLSTDEDGHRRGLAHIYTRDGSDGSEKITLTLPTVKCPSESCIEVLGIDQAGNLIPIDSLPKGENKVEFELKTLTGDVSLTDSGPYRLLINVTQTIDGEEYLRRAKGVIYVTVLVRGYSRVSCNSGDIAYSEEIKSGCEAQYTTKMRSAICGDC